MVDLFIRYKTNLIIFISSLILLYLLFNLDLFTRIMGFDQSIQIFGDYKANIKWLECNYLGFDVYKTNSCSSRLSYGPMFLMIPYNVFLGNFYINYLPVIIITLFVFISSVIPKLNNNLQGFIIIFSIFNPSTFLLIERLNFDIFIFLFIFAIAYNKIFFLNWLFIIFLTLAKIYPFVLGLSIFLENQFRSKIKLSLILLFMLTFGLVFLYLNWGIYDQVLNETNFKAGYHHLFSLKTIPKIIKYTFHWNYIVLMCCNLIIFYFLIKHFVNNILKVNNLIKIDLFNNQTKLFILSSTLILFCYITFSNFIYREIFLILLFPFLFDLYNSKKLQYVKFVFFILLIRYLFLFVYNYYNIFDEIIYVDGVRNFSNKFLIVAFIKGILDFILMSFIFAVTSILYQRLLHYWISSKKSIKL